MWMAVPSFRPLLVCAVLLRFVSCFAKEGKTGHILGRVNISPDFQPKLLDHGGLAAVRVIIDGGQFSALPQADGNFTLSGIPVGPHLLQVVHPVLRFTPVRVDLQVLKDGQEKVTSHVIDFERGKAPQTLRYPLVLRPSDTYTYLEKREEFNILTIFRNPMAIIGLISMGAMILLPKLQPMLEEEKERQLREAEAREGEGK
mmetsp:Transcript_44499/g.81280  ORF Transcript_44499/g.81280 Transcript_44499/m.81280 type:complete len:201 (-) Transcript_44499:95-697(-)